MKFKRGSLSLFSTSQDIRTNLPGRPFPNLSKLKLEFHNYLNNLFHIIAI